MNRYGVGVLVATLSTLAITPVHAADVASASSTPAVHRNNQCPSYSASQVRAIEAAARQGVVAKEETLGFLYLTGCDIGRDYAQARQWLTKAAAKRMTPQQIDAAQAGAAQWQSHHARTIAAARH